MAILCPPLQHKVARPRQLPPAAALGAALAAEAGHLPLWWVHPPAAACHPGRQVPQGGRVPPARPAAVAALAAAVAILLPHPREGRALQGCQARPVRPGRQGAEALAAAARQAVLVSPARPGRQTEAAAPAAPLAAPASRARPVRQVVPVCMDESLRVACGHPLWGVLPSDQVS